MQTKNSDELRVTSNKSVKSRESKNSSLVTRHSSLKNDVAFLWDESLLWGLMAYKALKSRNLPFNIIRSADIKNRQLKNYKMLFVPGGWASNKLKALGKKGITEIKRFVRGGGNYLGLCGGAGLATQESVGLLNVRRRPTKNRVPSFSGKIYLNISEHPIWNGLVGGNSNENSANTVIQNNSSLITPRPRPEASGRGGHYSSLPFHAWWPSQFLVEDKGIKVLAIFGGALPDSFSSDLNIGDVEADGSWAELEKIYKINLNPEKLINEPAVLEGSYGLGKVILSLIHFDTTQDRNGAEVLKNLWEYLAGQKTEVRKIRNWEDKSLSTSQLIGSKTNLSLLKELEMLVDELISLGERNFLWFWRNPMLLQWRRGVRGLEYCTLYVMIKEITAILKNGQVAKARGQRNIELLIGDSLGRIRRLLIPFIEKTKRLLIMERYALQNGHITYERCDSPEIQKLRCELFSTSKSHGGLFKKLIDEVDKVLYSLLIN
ncbi:MAG: BPL-N domain-containing protein [Thermodesulfovibrionia bacterium]|nr:BPL-N domain-containing protein [Thermodesulfovibrionia bacterium]